MIRLDRGGPTANLTIRGLNSLGGSSGSVTRRRWGTSQTDVWSSHLRRPSYWTKCKPYWVANHRSREVTNAMDLSEQKRGGPLGMAVLVLVLSILVGAVGVTLVMPRLSALSQTNGSQLVSTASALVSSVLTSPSSPVANRKGTARAAP